MSAQSESFDVAVVGGGAIGLACAWRAAQRGARVVVIDAGRARRAGTSPRACSRRSPRPSSASARCWSSGLESAAPLRGVLRRARGAGLPRRGHAGRRARPRRGRGAGPARRVPPRARAAGRAAAPVAGARLEPALAPTIRLALRHRLRPLRSTRACSSPRCGRVVTGTRVAARVTGLSVEGERVTGVRLDRRLAIAADAGRRRRGRRRRAAGACPSTRACRSGRSRARSCACATRTAPAWSSARSAASRRYFVPRGDGRYVLGATMEERGWDTTPTAGGVYELLRDLSELVPGVFELEIEELIAGPAARRRRTTCRRSAAARSRASSGPPATSATASCSRRSPPSSSPARSPASRCPDWAAAADPLPLRGGARMNVLLNGESAELADGATVETALRRRSTCRPRGAASRSRSTPKSSRAGSGTRPNCTKGRGWRSCARSREAEHGRHRHQHRRPDHRRQDAALAAAARHGRLPLARRAGGRAGGLRLASWSPSRCAGSTRPSAARSSTCSTAPASSCCPTPPAASPPATPC